MTHACAAPLRQSQIKPHKSAGMEGFCCFYGFHSGDNMNAAAMNSVIFKVLHLSYKYIKYERHHDIKYKK